MFLCFKKVVEDVIFVSTHFDVVSGSLSGAGGFISVLGSHFEKESHRSTCSVSGTSAWPVGGTSHPAGGFPPSPCWTCFLPGRNICDVVVSNCNCNTVSY